jgi:hypothetical protein
VSVLDAGPGAFFRAVERLADRARWLADSARHGDDVADLLTLIRRTPLDLDAVDEPEQQANDEELEAALARQLEADLPALAAVEVREALRHGGRVIVRPGDGVALTAAGEPMGDHVLAELERRLAEGSPRRVAAARAARRASAIGEQAREHVGGRPSRETAPEERPGSGRVDDQISALVGVSGNVVRIDEKADERCWRCEAIAPRSSRARTRRRRGFLVDEAGRVSLAASGRVVGTLEQLDAAWRLRGRRGR